MRRLSVPQGTMDGCGDEVTGFLAAASAVLENRSFIEAARSILEACRTTVGAPAGFVAIRKRGEDEFEVVTFDSAGRERESTTSMPPSLRRLSARASKSGKVVFTNSLPANPSAESSPADSVVVENALLAPIALADEVTGFLCLMNQPGGFTTSDSRLAEVFAEMAAVSMRNSRTVNNLESSRTALEKEVHAGAAQLWRSEGHFRALVENLPDVVARFDRHLRYIYVSPTMRRLSSRPAADFPGRTNSEMDLPAEVARRWDAALQRVFVTGRPEMVELEFPGPDAGLQYFDCRLVPERGPGGAIQSVLSVARDVTERWLALEAEKRARTVSDALRETTVLLNRSLDRESVMAMLLDCLRRLVPFDRAQVMLREDGSRVSIRAIFDGSRVVPFARDGRVAFDSAEHSIVNDILTTGTAVLIPDIRNRPDWSLPTDHTSEVSWMGIPLFSRGDVNGLFSLSKSEPDYFNEEHVRLAEAMSSQASVAVENSVLFEQMQASTIRLKALSRRLVEVQEDERRHIARELHDEAGQALVSLRYGLRLLERQSEAGEIVTERVAELVQRTDAVIDGLHRLAADLRPASLDHLGLEAALRQFSRTAGSGPGLVVRYKSRGFSDERFPPALETALYRVVQEAMTNVVRHAKATRVDIFAENRGDRIMVMVEDDGVGFDQDGLRSERSFGLLGMAERAEALGGKLTVESSPGVGTTIVVEVPIVHPHSDR